VEISRTRIRKLSALEDSLSAIATKVKQEFSAKVKRMAQPAAKTEKKAAKRLAHWKRCKPATSPFFASIGKETPLPFSFQALPTDSSRNDPRLN
jgi:hypothetical protein